MPASYVKRVEAVQWDGISIGVNCWNGLHVEYTRSGTLCVVPEDISSSGREDAAHKGDWIVRDKMGLFEVVPSERFVLLYGSPLHEMTHA